MILWDEIWGVDEGSDSRGQENINRAEPMKTMGGGPSGLAKVAKIIAISRRFLSQ